MPWGRSIEQTLYVRDDDLHRLVGSDLTAVRGCRYAPALPSPRSIRVTVGLCALATASCVQRLSSTACSKDLSSRSPAGRG
jgi:hypothetical protein